MITILCAPSIPSHLKGHHLFGYVDGTLVCPSCYDFNSLVYFQVCCCSCSKSSLRSMVCHRSIAAFYNYLHIDRTNLGSHPQCHNLTCTLERLFASHSQAQVLQIKFQLRQANHWVTPILFLIFLQI
jgi:hypothetical protein